VLGKGVLLEIINVNECLGGRAAGGMSDCFSHFIERSLDLILWIKFRHVDLFHLVITDNQRPETLSLHGLALPIKPTTQFTQGAAP
jgi:hypothetical protein